MTDEFLRSFTSDDIEDLLISQMERQFKDAESDYGSELRSAIGPEKLESILRKIDKKETKDYERQLSEQVGVTSRDMHLLLRDLKRDDVE